MFFITGKQDVHDKKQDYKDSFLCLFYILYHHSQINNNYNNSKELQNKHKIIIILQYKIFEINETCKITPNMKKKNANLTKFICNIPTFVSHQHSCINMKY